jgi:D-glycero-D-manno-heptose 1,7-bisphosphate phosphatase
MTVKTDKVKNGRPSRKSNMSFSGKAAVFLDRDGTIIEDRGHLRDMSDVVFFPETFEALQKLRNYFLLFIVTNQVGVAEGIITSNDVDRINRCIVSALAERGIVITDVYVCPHRRADNCPCIKPKPYFLRKAAKRYGIDLGVSFAVGDHPHDIQLAQNTGAHGIYVLSGHGHKHRAEISAGIEVVTGIKQATEKIMSI